MNEYASMLNEMLNKANEYVANCQRSVKNFHMDASHADHAEGYAAGLQAAQDLLSAIRKRQETASK